MATTVFVNGVTLTDAEWFNDTDLLVYEDAVSAKNSTYGAQGDGVTNDTSAITSFLASGAPVLVIPRGTYVISGSSVTIADNSVVIADNVVFSMTLAAVADNAKPAIDIGSNVRIIGSISVSVTITGGTPADNQTGVIRIGSGSTAKHNVRIDSLTYTATSIPTGWNAVQIESSTHDVKIGTVTVAGGGFVSRAVLVHWGSSGPTLHPYDIEIGSIVATNGDITDTAGAAFYVSGGYNCSVKQIICDSYYSSVTTYAGDFGASGAAASVAALIGRNIVVDAITATNMVNGGIVAGLPTISGSALDMPLVIGSAELTGRGAAAGAGEQGNGLSLDDCIGVRIGKFSATAFYFSAASLGDRVFDCEIWARKIQGNGYNGVYMSGPSAGGHGIRIRGGKIYNNGSNAAGDSFVNGVYVNNYADVVVDGTVFGAAGEANQKYGVQANGNASRVRLINTHVIAVKAGGNSYFFGNGSGWRAEAGNYIIDNATFTSGIAGFGGTFTCTVGYNGLRTFYATSIPTAITGVQGEQCINMAGTIGQPRAWTCSAAGTPGTWTSWGNL